MPARRTVLIIVVIAAAAIISLILLRNMISGGLYSREGAELVEKLPPALRAKYGEELEYTLDKFWNCYKDDIVSQNDMTDVMERIRELKGRTEITDNEIFEFIGMVSGIYTEGMRKRHTETEYRKLEEEVDSIPGL